MKLVITMTAFVAANVEKMSAWFGADEPPARSERARIAIKGTLFVRQTYTFERKLHHLQWKVREVVLRESSRSQVASLIEPSIHFILNSWICLERKRLVFESRILSGLWGLDEKYSKVSKFLMETGLSSTPKSSLRRLTWKTRWTLMPTRRSRR